MTRAITGIRIGASSLALVSLLGFAVPRAMASNPEPTVTVGYFTNPNPEKVAKEMGWFSKYIHAKIKWVPVETGATALAEMASGSLDIVSAVGNPPIATAISKGLQFEVVWVNENSAEALVAKSSIKSVSDLQGKKVGVAFGSTSQFTLMGALSLNHANPSKVQIYDMSPSDQVAAWQRGDIQAAYVWEPFLDQMLKDGGHILVKSSQLATKGYPVFDAVVVNKSFAQSHRAIVQGFVRAEQLGTLYYENHPMQAYKLIAKDVGITPAEAEQESKVYTFPNASQQISTAWMGLGTKVRHAVVAQGIIATSKWLKSNNSISSVPSQNAVASSIDPSFAAALVKK